MTTGFLSWVRHAQAVRWPDSVMGRHWLTRHSLAEPMALGDAKGMSIAVVGNARALLDTDHGDDIDSHDIVLRMNRAPGIGSRGAGSRMDWLCTSKRTELSSRQMESVKRIFWMTPKRRKLPLSLVMSGKLCLYPPARQAELQRKLGSRPSTGAMVCEMLSRTAAKSIDIYGFDFFRSGTSSSKVTAETSPHDFVAEAHLAEDLISRDARFSLKRLG